MEELGELAHAHLKQEQGIRSNEDHDAAARDAIGDVVIYLMDYCSVRGWDFSDCVSEAWGDVSERDWIANPATGTEAPDAT
jgi:NTP pyrophosphatase (non-canonical NTP hydrolase)